MDERYFCVSDILPAGEGRLIGLGARPGTGKTTLLLDIMLDYAINRGTNVLYISLEAPKKWITDTIAVKRTLTGEDKSRITVDTGIPFPTVKYVEETIGKCNGVKAVFIDYISLLHGDSKTVLEVLKGLCKEKSMDIFYGCCLPKSKAADGRPIICPASF